MSAAGEGLGRTRSMRGESSTSPSRLPTKGGLGLARAGSTRLPAANSKASEIPNKRPPPRPRLRPLSSILPSTGMVTATATATATARQLSSSSRREPTSATEPNRRPQSLATAVARPTSCTSTSTSTSTSARASTASNGPPAHARAKPSVTALTSATTLGPVAQPCTTVAVDVQAASRPAATGTAASSRQAYKAHSTNHHPPVSCSSSSDLVAPAPAPAPAPAAAAEPRLRPAFTAFQQHYSPAKSLAPKPLTSAFLAPPSPSKLPANVAASAETSRLQSELLQLHLLHRDAGPVQVAWHASARARLGARFRDLAQREVDVGARERRCAELENLVALLCWTGRERSSSSSSSSSSNSIITAGTNVLVSEESIQTIDKVLGTVWSLGEPGGRYTRCLDRFERWVQALRAVMDRRRRLEGEEEEREEEEEEGLGEPMFVTELDAGWKDECAGLARRLDECRRMLRGLGGAGAADEPWSTSSLAVLLRTCRALIDDMLAELHVMELMEREAVADENAWVRAMNEKNMTLKERHGHDDPRAGAIWRAL